MFKDYIDSDITTFLNMDEFADQITINGSALTAIFIDVTDEMKAQSNDELMAMTDKILSVCDTDNKKYEVGNLLKINSLSYTILKAITEMGIMHLYLRRFK